MKKTGWIHSIETLGTRDGPGLRCVFFLAGCNFKCKFCQNRDTWTRKNAEHISLDQIHSRLNRLLPYLQKNGGGITVSGGEPSLQAEFVIELFKLAHSLELSTVLDTNGSCEPKYIDKLMDETDIILLDIKASTEKLHRSLTGASLEPVLKFGKIAAETWELMDKPKLVIRRVLLPGINNSKKELEILSDYVLGLKKTPPIELIPYHKLGIHKWKELGLKYPLNELKPPDEAEFESTAKYFRKKGIEVYRG